MQDGKGVHVRIRAGHVPSAANKDNDYLIDRAAQKRGETYQRRRRHRHAGRLAAGKHGADRRPHQGKPGSTDNGIIMARHRLMRAAKALVEKGTSRPALPQASAGALGRCVLPPDQPFKEAAKEALPSRAGTAHASV